ncbi:MAG: hypothetical protein RLZZ435_3432 [Cyanobacteriota bacterium]
MVEENHLPSFIKAIYRNLLFPTFTGLFASIGTNYWESAARSVAPSALSGYPFLERILVFWQVHLKPPIVATFQFLQRCT